MATVLSPLSDHDWAIVLNRWCRGIDWVVEKRGSRWYAGSEYRIKTGFRTKGACYDAVTAVVLAEARIRAEAA